MYKYVSLLFLYFIVVSPKGYTQDFNGQWKGSFEDKSVNKGSFGNDLCDYVLELDVTNNKVSGSSYTYFTENGKKFYTICKVEGFVEPKKKYIEVIETERTKTNIPNNISNCLQVHKLTYFKKGSVMTLEGNWTPVPKQKGNCGFGTTLLTKRSLVNSYPKLITKSNSSNAEKNESSEGTESKSKIKTEKNIDRILENDRKIVSGSNSFPKEKVIDNKLDNVAKTNTDLVKLENRKSTIIKTIEIESQSIKIDLYDNGEVDGDSISLFYNKKLLLSKRKLTEKAISLTLKFDDHNDVNELVMYAENLGSIPPNTALMVVTDGPNRYEVRITSDLEKSGMIRFIHKTN